MNNQNKAHLYDVKRLTGVAILLVVMGHLATGNAVYTKGMEWYKFFSFLIYSFHMPLFMFISGFIFYYTYPGINQFSEYKQFVKKRFIRLAPSYILFASIIFSSKIILESVFIIDNPVKSFQSFFEVFYKPTQSYAGFLWYIYVLFEYCLVMPILVKLTNNRIGLILIASIPLHFLRVTNFLGLNFFLQFLFFFVFGMYAAKNISKYYEIIDAYRMIFILVFGISLIAFFYLPVPKIIMGIISIPAIHSLVRFDRSEKNNMLWTLGHFTFSIYLMNTLVGGFVKAIGFKFFNWSYSSFYFPAIVMILSMLIVPIFLKKYIINKIPIIQKYVG